MSIIHNGWSETKKTIVNSSNPTERFLNTMEKLNLATDLDYLIIWLTNTIKETNEILDAQKTVIASLGVPVGP